MSKSRAVFTGQDASGKNDLWVTDGTSAGTSELAVAGEYSGGLFADSVWPNFTVFGSRTLFEGEDANGHYNLWITDGTSAGTTELTGAGANAFGLFYDTDFEPGIFGNQVLFEGFDASGHYGLWATDGTSAGTSELNVAGAYSRGLFSNVGFDFTMLGNRALFDGEDANGQDNLWITDGTAKGTKELGPAGASSNLDPFWITALGNKAVFEGTDSRGQRNLWVTDGTAAGTSELAVIGAYSSGLDPNSMTAIGNKVVFEGKDANGLYSLWVTDGTSAGTSELTVAGAFPKYGLQPGSFTVLGGRAI